MPADHTDNSSQVEKFEIGRGRDVKTLDTPPYEVTTDYKRVKTGDIVFERVGHDEDFSLYGRQYYERLPEAIRQNGPGNTRFDHALLKASRSIYEAMMGIRALESKSMGITEEIYRGPVDKYASGLPRVEAVP